jgi:hypothetical protein
MKYKYLAIIALTSAVTAPSALSQTTDGVLDDTSTGQVDINLQVLDSVEITGLNDISFGTYGGSDTGPRGISEGYCVYVNGAGDYDITASSTNGPATNDATQFHLVGGTLLDEIMYTVKFVGAASGASSASVTNYADKSATFAGSSRRDCSGSDNAQLHIDITEQELRDASTDTYQDTLILLVSPV